MRIGVISDTHGLLRPAALAFLEGCEHIVHGGDIGDDQQLLRSLAAIAPLTVVRGNNDNQDWQRKLPATADLELAGIRLFVLHDLGQLRIDPAAEGIRVVISGHSHKPLSAERAGVLYLNPGSAGPRRFSLPISIAELRLDGVHLQPRIVDLRLG